MAREDPVEDEIHSSPDLDLDAPRESQTIRLPEEKLDSLREWAVEGTGLTAAARVRDSDGRIALVQNRWSDGWILPGGAVESGETPTEAARREVLEETGLTATTGDLLVVLDQRYVSRTDGEERFSAYYLVYEAHTDGGSDGERESEVEITDSSELGTSPDEISAARWFETLPENLHDGDLLRPYL
jgi:8-oxo-dGTP pyrophosphatase MutT (NUDIX family)